MVELVKSLFRRLTCRHKEYEFLADLSMRHVVTRRYKHEVTIACCRCGKRKDFTYWAAN